MPLMVVKRLCLIKRKHKHRNVAKQSDCYGTLFELRLVWLTPMSLRVWFSYFLDSLVSINWTFLFVVIHIISGNKKKEKRRKRSRSFVTSTGHHELLVDVLFTTKKIGPAAVSWSLPSKVKCPISSF